LPSVCTISTFWKPASRASLAMYSAPSFELRFSAAIDGSAIQSCRRLSDSSWRLPISALIAALSVASSACAEPVASSIAHVAMATLSVFRSKARNPRGMVPPPLLC